MHRLRVARTPGVGPEPRIQYVPSYTSGEDQSRVQCGCKETRIVWRCLSASATDWDDPEWGWSFARVRLDTARATPTAGRATWHFVTLPVDYLDCAASGKEETHLMEFRACTNFCVRIVGMIDAQRIVLVYAAQHVGLLSGLLSICTRVERPLESGALQQYSSKAMYYATAAI